MRPPRLMLPLLALPLLAADPPPVPLKVQTEIKTFFANTLLSARYAQWRFYPPRPFPEGGAAYCGEVNMQNGRHQYRGFKPFYTTVFADGVHEGDILDDGRDDPTGAERFKIDTLCGRQ